MNLRAGLVSAGWGLFCACSWTWCIGMFMPIILLGDFGWPGFLVFAVPNVLGCAAFGYVLRNASRRAELIQRHERAAVVFSAVVVAYHLFFMAFLATMIARGSPRATLVAVTLPAGVYLAGYGFSWMPQRAWPVAAAVLYAGSIAVFVAVGTTTLSATQWSGTLTTTDLLCLAPALVFGLLLCPYLDLTFHRALDAAPSRHAFAVFGIAFIPILLLTVAYRQGVTAPLVVAYMTVQATFTVAAHVREIRGRSWPRSRASRSALLLVPAAAVALALVPGDGENTYLRFLGFFGLIFPAYVLVFMTRRTPVAPRGVFLAGWALAMIAFVPVYETAFVHRITWPAGIPVAALLAWALWRKVRRV